ncbi:MAG: cupredoxin domain-containing protein [Thermoproteota archaeon]|nr:cupredoxin domain-containing protein [Thermoproteota archaeon]
MSVRNNTIAVLVVSFAVVGVLWGIGRLIKPEPEADLPAEDILLISQRSSFNGTNPDLHVEVNIPAKLVVRNEDAVTHDLKVDSSLNAGITPINTAPLRGGQQFLTAIVTSKPGIYEYYCSYHPQMRGQIISQ